jgi:phosphoglycolate phosphatase-like HAD superfamily hydrolase
MIKLVILDFDGVVVESVDIKTEAFRELFQEHPNVEEIVQYHLGNNPFSRFIKFKYIYENILEREYTEEVKQELGRKFSEIVFQKVVECPYVNGAEEFLRIFSRVLPIYLISATPQQELESIVAKRNIGGYFREVWGIPPGNKVDYFKQALRKENVKAEEAVSVGDMREDFRVAREVGVLFVGRRHKESFDGLGVPEYSDMAGITEWLQNKIGAGLL